MSTSDPGPDGDDAPGSTDPSTAPPVPCAGAIVHDSAGRLLLIQRGTPPARGTWTLPGGRCEREESSEQACVREVLEETGLRVRVDRLAGRVLRNGPDGVVFSIDDFFCTPLGGTLAAATDAADVRWVDDETYRDLDRQGALAPLLTEALSAWNAIPRR